MMTDKEFLNGLSTLKIAISEELREEFYQKAKELVKRPATRAAQRAYERELSLRKLYQRKRFELTGKWK